MFPYVLNVHIHVPNALFHYNCQFFPPKAHNKIYSVGLQKPFTNFQKIWVSFLVYIGVPSVVPLPKIVTNSFGNKSFMLSMKRLLTCKSRGVRFFLLGERGNYFCSLLFPKGSSSSQHVPNSTSGLCHMVCPKFSSHLSIYV
jgi:hypothetical protein